MVNSCGVSSCFPSIPLPCARDPWTWSWCEERGAQSTWACEKILDLGTFKNHYTSKRKTQHFVDFKLKSRVIPAFQNKATWENSAAEIASNSDWVCQIWYTKIHCVIMSFTCFTIKIWLFGAPHHPTFSLQDFRQVLCLTSDASERHGHCFHQLSLIITFWLCELIEKNQWPFQSQDFYKSIDWNSY